MATLSQVGIPGSGNGILHPKHKNRFQLVFQGLSTAGTNLTAQVVSTNRPQLEFEEIQLHRYNSVAFVAGKHQFSDLQITIEDDLTGLASIVVQQQLERQQRLIGSDNANGNWLNAAATASAYKFSARLEMLDGNEVVTESWQLEGCWIKSVEYGDLDYSASEAVTISLTVRYDHAWQILNSAANGSAGKQAIAGFQSSAPDFSATSAG
jgi:hypothetical protein